MSDIRGKVLRNIFYAKHLLIILEENKYQL